MEQALGKGAAEGRRDQCQYAEAQESLQKISATLQKGVHCPHQGGEGSASQGEGGLAADDDDCPSGPSGQPSR